MKKRSQFKKVYSVEEVKDLMKAEGRKVFTNSAVGIYAKENGLIKFNETTNYYGELENEDLAGK